MWLLALLTLYFLWAFASFRGLLSEKIHFQVVKWQNQIEHTCARKNGKKRKYLHFNIKVFKRANKLLIKQMPERFERNLIIFALTRNHTEIASLKFKIQPIDGGKVVKALSSIACAFDRVNNLTPCVWLIFQLFIDCWIFIQIKTLGTRYETKDWQTITDFRVNGCLLYDL